MEDNINGTVSQQKLQINSLASEGCTIEGNSFDEFSKLKREGNNQYYKISKPQNEEQILAKLDEDFACRKSYACNRRLSRKLSEHSENGIPEKMTKISPVSASDVMPANYSSSLSSSFSLSPSMLPSCSSSEATDKVNCNYGNNSFPLQSDTDQNSKSRRYKKTHEALQGSGMLHITMKTAELIKKNHKLQKDISNFKQEVKVFMKDVLKNPENVHLCKKEVE